MKNLIKISVVLAILLMLVPVVWSQQTAEGRDFASKTWASSEFPWEFSAMILTLISFGVAAIAFMFSRIFQSKELERWSKTEFMFALSTVFLIAMIILFIDVLAEQAVNFSAIVARDRPALETHFASLRANGERPNAFTITEFYLERLETCMVSKYIDLVCIGGPVLAISSIDTSYLAKNFKGLSKLFLAPVFGPLQWIKNLMSLGAHNATYAIYAINLQQHILNFARETMLTIFLPVGIILRAFVLTRGAGNLLIAVSIGLYFIYPITYGVFISISKPVSELESRCDITGYGSVSEVLDIGPCTATLSKFSRFTFPKSDEDSESSRKNTFTVSSPADFSLKSVYNLVYGFGFFSRISSPDSIKETAKTFIEEVIEFMDVIKGLISEIMLYVIFYPFAVATVVFTFIKSFTIFLGTDAQEFAQGLVKII